ncbi:MAG: 4Fe-4S dicluster domain-containing protein [Thermodesulfovibrionales bacterium]|nr:4Fe-4S dicluster domain-containing protein [Thermodesulfovibrionales bacterium]
MAKYGMVIDLLKCVGCGACAIACKTENNTQDRADGQTFNWADFVMKVEGKFPNVKYTAMPTLCNHCTDAPCVAACPVKPKAMFKTADGITMHNDERCIGCRACQKACPYSSMDVEKEKAPYSVISFNDHSKETQPRYRDKTEMIPGCTTSGAEVAKVAGDIPPFRTLYKHPEYTDVRRKGITEKCIFCEHRIKNGEQPYCVAACPSKARVFGDLNDANSEISKLLKANKPVRLKNNKGEILKDGEKGTQPNVYYIKGFKAVAKK